MPKGVPREAWMPSNETGGSGSASPPAGPKRSAWMAARLPPP